MRQLLLLMIAATLLNLGGCATQGRLTYLTFEKSYSYEVLDASMEKLKRQGYDGSIQQKMSALREARYISKHMGDPGKQEMALRALVFLAFSSEDGDVRDRSMARLEDILESEDWPMHMRYSLIDSTFALVSADLGFQEEYDGMMMHFGVEADTREEALEFILDDFENLKPEFQYYMVSSLHNLLLTPVTLENCPFDICDEDVRKDTEAWENGREVKTVIPDNADPVAVKAGAYGPESKIVPIDERTDWNEELDDLKEIVWKWVGDQLEEPELPLAMKGRMIRLAGEIENYSLQEEMLTSFIEVTQEWSEEEDIAADLRQLLAASREKVNLYGYPASKPPVPSQSSFDDMEQRQLDFIETHLDSIFQQQLQRQKRGFRVGSHDPVNIVFASYDETHEAMLKKVILLDIVHQALKRGLQVSTKGLTQKMLSLIENTTSENSLRSLLNITSELYASFKKDERQPIDLLAGLAAQAVASESLTRKRLFIQAMLPAFEHFPEDVNLALSEITDLDVVTNYQIQNLIKESEATL